MLIRTAVLALVTLAGTAPAQTLPPPAPAPQPQPLSIIKQDPQTGMVMRLETTPEEAALDLVHLDEKEKAEIARIVSERGAIIDRVVSANIGTLLKSQGFRKDDTLQERMQAMVELQKQASGPLGAYNKEHGQLMQQIEKLIAPEKAATVRKLAADYRTAIQLQNEATFRTTKEKDEQKRLSQIRGMETMLAFGLDVRRSYDRHIAAKDGQLDAMLKAAGVTPEQESRIAALNAEYVMTTEGRPTMAQRRDLFQKVFLELDDRQKMVLLSEIYGVKAPEARPETIAAPVGAQPVDAYTIKYVTTDTQERTTPDQAGAADRRLSRGEAVKVYEVKGEWARVTPQGDARGARWVPAGVLSVDKPGTGAPLNIKPDPRVVNLPVSAGDGLTERDVLFLHAAARYFVESGKAESVTGGRKGADNLYYLLVGPREVPVTTSEVPDLQKRIDALRN